MVTNAVRQLEDFLMFNTHITAELVEEMLSASKESNLRRLDMDHAGSRPFDNEMFDACKKP